MSTTQLWECVGSFCGYLHQNETRYNLSGSTSYADVYYPGYRKNLCRADFYREFINSDGALITESAKEVSQYYDDVIFDFLEDCGAPSGTQKITLYPPETVNQRVEIREMSMASYGRSFHFLTTFFFDDTYGTAEDRRTFLYSQSPLDQWTDDEDPDNSDGVALSRQMYASMTSMMESYKNLKFENSEDLLNEGVFQGDEWGSSDYGRIPALRQIYGTLKEDDEPLGPGWAASDISFHPTDFGSLPPMSKSLQNAITMLSNKNVTNHLKA